MADIHILEGNIKDEDRAIYRYVLHIPTDASPSLRAKAVLDESVSAFASVLGEAISPGELNQIQAGQVVEEVHTITYHKNDTPTEYLGRVREQWVEQSRAAPGDFEHRYQWFANEYPRE